MALATSALAADQAALSATADNISNQNTEGYTRRAVSWSSGDAVVLGGTTTARGITATAVAQRDNVLQRAVVMAAESSSASDTRLAALDDLQSLFKIDSSGDDASGIGAAVSDFFNAASALGSRPTDGIARQTVFTAAHALASALNRTAGQMAVQSASLNQTIEIAVAQANDLASTIASLNRQISQAAAGDDAEALLDERDLAVMKLAKLMDVNTITSSAGRMSLALSDGTPLVMGSSALPLTTGKVNGQTRIYASVSVGGAEVSAAFHGGSIGGALQVRDSDIPGVMAQLDAIAGAISSAVNTQNAEGTDVTGAPGGAIFSGSTASTLTVVARDAGAIAASPDGSNAADLGALQDALLVGGRTFSGAFSDTISSLGTVVFGAETKNTSDTSVLTQMMKQRDAVSGVSLDTEAANLTQFQRSYQAAAKILSIVNQLMAQAINLGTPTTVS
jgi:flagellar hook-associated protein 1 FlgK